MKKLLFSIAMVASLGVAVFSFTPTDTYANSVPRWCMYWPGGGFDECVQLTSNCFCDAIVVYG